MQSIREKLHTRLNSWLNGKQVKKQSPSFHPNTGVNISQWWWEKRIFHKF